MATPKKLDSTCPVDFNSEDDSPPASFSISIRRSHRKRSVSDAVIEEEIDTKAMKKKKLAASKVIWTEQDVLALLKGLVEYRAKTALLGSKIDWDEFFGFIKGSIVAKVSKTQVLSKIRKLKRKFLIQYEKNNGRCDDPCFTKVSDSQAFGFSLLLWGKNGTQEETGGKMVEKDANAMPLNENEKTVTTGKDDTRAAAELCVVQEAFIENQEVANFESLNEKEVAKTGFDGKDSIDAEELCTVQEEAAKTDFGDKPHLEEIVVDEIIPENVIVEKDISYADELSAIQDAFEFMMSQGLSDYQKKMQLENLMNIGAEKRRELSKEWRELCVEIAQLNIKKLKFTAKLAETAATDKKLK